MAIGLGIVLLLAGLILLLDVVTIDLSFVDDAALGTVLVVVGALADKGDLLRGPRDRKHLFRRRFRKLLQKVLRHLLDLPHEKRRGEQGEAETGLAKVQAAHVVYVVFARITGNNSSTIR